MSRIDEIKARCDKIAKLTAEEFAALPLSEIAQIQCDNKRLATRLTQYREAEEDGVLVRLPIPIKGIVYIHQSGTVKPMSVSISNGAAMK